MGEGTVLLTGGAGFIGSHVALRLAERGQSVTVLDNFSSGSHCNIARLEELGVNLELVEGDIRDRSVVDKLAQRAAGIVHLAAMISVQDSLRNPDECFAINDEGSRNVFHAAHKAGGIPVVFASSAAVYGDQAPVPVDESEPVNPLSPYGASKAAAEAWASSWSACGTPVVPLRFFNVYGEYQDPSGAYAAVISKFADCCVEDQDPTIFGDGSQTRDFVHVADVARAVVSALDNAPSCAGRPINIGTGSESSLLDLVSAFETASGTTMTPQFSAPRSGDIHRSCASVSLARELLGFAAATPLADGLRRLLAAGTNQLPQQKSI